MGEDNNFENHEYLQDATCKTCHTEDASVQYKNHTAPSCNSCHDQIGSSSYVTGSQHPNGWVGVKHAMRALNDIESCTTCHTNLSSCSSCHREEDVMPERIHVGIDFMKIQDGKMNHGAIANQSGGMLCGACHSPSKLERHEKHEPSCKKCHDE